jgi:hypothetical protein
VPDDPAEYQRFLDIAREVGADEDQEALDRAFEKVIRAPVIRIPDSQEKPDKAKTSR